MKRICQVNVFWILTNDKHFPKAIRANKNYGLWIGYTLSQYPGWIHPGKFPGENDAYKISPRWKRFEFSTSPVCIGNLSLLERNCELLMFPSEFLKFWYFAGDIALKVFGSWLTSVSFKIYTGYK